EPFVLRNGPEVLLDPTFALEREKRIGVVDHRRDLRSAADDALVLDERVDVAVLHARDAFDVESVERLSDRRPLRVDDAPADPRLKNAFARMLEVVVEGLRGVLRRRPFHRSILPAPPRL